MIQRAKEILSECYKLAPELGHRLDTINFHVSRRMTRAAGTAQPYTGKIKLSAAFFEDAENFKNDFDNTVTHEIAHVLSPPTRSKGRKSSHGFAWVNMHCRLGGTGSRCHTLELAHGYERKASVRVRVTCPKCDQDMTLGPTQLKKHLKGLARYTHGKCPR